ncbi:MAG: transglutaminase-like domain-containing protein [Eggerthellaceae bacterium]|nr:transglutaminase-like domain-containing protein [Eggerthellaceae bacterium]
MYGCSGGSNGETSGPPFTRASLALNTFNAAAAVHGANGTLIDASSVALGYVGASGVSSARLNFQVSCGNMSYHYNMPNDGTPIICPLNMGSGDYTFTVWQNTSGDRYVEFDPPVTVTVTLESDLDPFLRPGYYCNYDANSACVALANQLTANAENQGDALESIYDWIVQNVSYDYDKAATVVNATDYIPSPDETMQTGKGICFDYSALAAAMLRSQGIPCTIMTGYVSPDNIYHAWNKVYIDGTWKTATISINAKTWSLIDTTFASGGNTNYAGNGSSYTERYTY